MSANASGLTLAGRANKLNGVKIQEMGEAKQIHKLKSGEKVRS
jgi:hypothetical protein